MSEYGDNPETTPNGDTCPGCEYAARLRTELTEVRKERKDWMLRAAKYQAALQRIEIDGERAYHMGGEAGRKHLRMSIDVARGALEDAKNSYEKRDESHKNERNQ